MENLIKVGHGIADITPESMLPLAGYGNTAHRISTEIRDSLKATCIAFTDPDDNTVLLFTTDMIRVDPKLAGRVRDVLCPEFNLPRENVQIAATHTHSAPEMGEEKFPGVLEFHEKYVEGLVTAGRKAMGNRFPAVAYVGFTPTERMNFIRHYKIADGSYAGANFGNWAPGVVGHASNNDSWVQVIKFERIGAKPIILVNFQAHPCFTGGVDKTVTSSDYIGELRNYIQTMTGAKFAFFQGAAGNHNGISFYARETRTSDCTEYAKLLGEYVLKALEAPVQVQGNKIALTHRVVDLPLDHTEGSELVAKCKEINDEWLEKADRNHSNKRAREIGLNSIYAVRGVLMRQQLPESEEMDIAAFRVGDLGFVTAPYEMFGTNGMFIKEYAPYAMTFVVSCANHAQAYLASDLAFTHGCYEVDTRRFPRGTAERLANEFVEMLHEIK